VTLNQLKAGQRGSIIGLDESLPVSARLSELGLVPGQEVWMLQKAPFGEPMQIRVMNYDLCLRRADAAAVLVSATGDHGEGA